MNRKAIAAAVGLSTATLFGAVAETTVVGDWAVKVTYENKSAIIEIPRAEIHDVKGEAVVLPDYMNQASGWTRGMRPAGIKAQECTSRHLIVEGSMSVNSAADGTGQSYIQGKDFLVTPEWGTVGRMPEGRIPKDATVYISYRHYLRRLDSIVLTANGDVVLRRGKDHAATPEQPALAKGELRLANIWLDGKVDKLDNDVNVYPLLEQEYPELPQQSPCIAEQLIPRAYAKLKNGEPIRILAWGDSVTVGTFVPDPATQRWQMQFLKRLKEAFPKASITLETEAWAGRRTNSYFSVPAGQEHNYQEQVLDKKPDLVISEFVNDAVLDRKGTYANYSRIRDDFKAIGAEWIILTPHYVRPDWMGLTREKNVDEDPREYVKALRDFATENHIALADASLRYGRLWRRGIPGSSLMVNAINHPNPFGLSLFADALMALFR